MINPDAYLIAPFYSKVAGLSYDTFGDLLQFSRELGPGRYPIQNADGRWFAMVIYSDSSWRLSSSQLELFPV